MIAKAGPSRFRAQCVHYYWAPAALNQLRRCWRILRRKRGRRVSVGTFREPVSPTMARCYDVPGRWSHKYQRGDSAKPGKIASDGDQDPGTGVQGAPESPSGPTADC